MFSPPFVKLGRVSAAPAALITLARRSLTPNSRFLCTIGGFSCDFAASRTSPAPGFPAMAPGLSRPLQTESPRWNWSPDGRGRPASPSGDNLTAPQLVVVSFYKFTDFPDHVDFKKPLKDLCETEVVDEIISTFIIYVCV